MDFNNIDELKSFGFTGFKKVKELWDDNSVIPNMMGVYVVLNPYYDEAKFLQTGTGGFFKGRDPNVSEDNLITIFAVMNLRQKPGYWKPRT